MHKLSFLAKLTLFGFLLSALPVLFIGITSYVTAKHEIEEHVTRSKMQLLRQTNANVEQVLSTVNHTLNQLVSSTVVKEAITISLSEQSFEIYNNLRNELGHLQAFDTKLEDVILVNEALNWLVKNSGLYQLDEYAYHQELLSMTRIPDSTSWMLNPSGWFHGEELAVQPGCPYNISLVKQLPPNSLDKIGFVAANIPACSLQDVIQYNIDEESGRVMIVDDRLRILLHPDPSLIGRTVAETGVFAPELLRSQSADQVTTRIDGKPYTLSYYRSGFNGWYYISLVSIDSITRESGKIGQYTLYVCLALLLLSMAIAWLGSRRMYSPIGQLLRQVAPGGRQRGKGDELQVISDEVRGLFRSKSALEQEVRGQLGQVRTFDLIKVYQGNVKPSRIPERLRRYGYGAQLDSWRTMAVVTLQIDGLEQTRYKKEDLPLLLFAVDNMVAELVPAEHLAAPVAIETTAAALIGHADGQQAAFTSLVYGLTERLRDSIESYLSLTVSIGISLPFSDVRRLPEAYREGRDALRHRMKLGEGIIIQYADVNSGKHYLNLNYPKQKEAELMDAIKLADTDKAGEVLARLMEAVFQAELPPQEYEIPLNRLLNNLLILMQESGIGQAQLQASGSLFEELHRRQTAAEIEEWFRERIVVPLAGVFRDRQEQQYHNISEQIIEIVRRRYDTELTLEQCAAELHYNANYLSSVFRKETNSSFSEYLAAYRLNVAKKWLAETELPIKDIAARLQYTNSQNFIRSFRKQESMTPGQYREQHKM
ncbi:helix-turn-helix domain-containing protein [Paenibacillus sp. IB182496]|uniref:Helix-turn-helix domain-containing protein n=1 Tax=Paenibacillus sabuli TaxID=2772509 RepID=A0A927BTB9_9BACL|nr:helix-turn-helix domain-containing protein [Paenibacillus sabuli]MBD2845526.1 helix-turn-helix domain-containing protein [Paenibacillus sabuli]